MAMRSTAAILVLCLWLPLVESFGSGAPDKACRGGSPLHSNAAGPQQSVSPYKIELSSYNYTADQQITMTLSGQNGEQIGGFLLQVKRADPRADTQELIGSFSVSSDSKQTCSKDNLRALTHKAPTLKNNIQTTWTAPANPTGDLYVYAAVAAAYQTFWKQQAYATLRDPTSAPAPTGQSPVTQDVTQGAAIPEFVTSTCGSSKGCYRDPPGCAASECQYIVTWQQAGDFFLFELESSSDGWVAVGFSESPQMFSTSVTACVYDESSGRVNVEMSFNKESQKRNEILADPTQGLDPTSFQGSKTGNRLRCTFRRRKVVMGADSTRLYNLDKPYYVMVGKGAASGGFMIKHKQTPIVSPQKVDLAETRDVSGQQSSPTLLKVHGCLMGVAWILCATFGMIVARFYKPMWPNTKPFDLQLWFVIHRTVMVTTALATIAGFVIVFVHVKGYSDYPDLPEKAHPILGLIVTAFVIINPIMAMCRPDKDAPNRRIFNFAHYWVGTIALAVAEAAILIGVGLPAMRLPRWPFWVMVAMVAFHFVFSIFMEIHEAILRRRSGDEGGTAHATIGQKGDMSTSIQVGQGVTGNSPPGEKVKKIALFVHLTVMLGFAATLVVVIVTN